MKERVEVRTKHCKGTATALQQSCRQLQLLWIYQDKEVQLTSGRVDVDLEPPLGGDDLVVVVVVEVGDVVTLGVVQTQLSQGNGDLENITYYLSR